VWQQRRACRSTAVSAPRWASVARAWGAATFAEGAAGGAGELAGVGARLVGGAAAAPRLRATLATKDLLPRAKLRVEMRPRRMIPGQLGFCPACREA
jgi:hypothetical protein